ncbi:MULTISPECIES: hypothetical protein [Cyanophyceae]|uniref:hypothetical protein n=1 Tax=Cyanophyceae TaxID=3028117 RepID=UPI000A0F36D1|nr:MULTISPECIES: hypothetical protein [Cyanophyceae]SMH54162.1 hypothetical protein SAMN06272755_2766 [Picosynechococcus sp. OG1]SMQ82869.1 hypothetical protein SAMN06272774_2042 [Synechococcus sp. 7002]
MKCQKCNSEKVITLSSGRQVCQECKAVQNQHQSLGCFGRLSILWFMICVFIGVPLMVSENINEQRERQQYQEKVHRQQEVVSDYMKSLSDINQSQTEMLGKIYGGNSAPTPIREPRYNQCDCPYDIFYYTGEERYCGNNSAYVRTGGRSPACFVGEY